MARLTPTRAGCSFEQDTLQWCIKQENPSSFGDSDAVEGLLRTALVAVLGGSGQDLAAAAQQAIPPDVAVSSTVSDLLDGALDAALDMADAIGGDRRSDSSLTDVFSSFVKSIIAEVGVAKDDVTSKVQCILRLL